MSDTATEHDARAEAERRYPPHSEHISGSTESGYQPIRVEVRDDRADAFVAGAMWAAGFRLRGCCSPPGDTTQCLDCPEQETEA